MPQRSSLSQPIQVKIQYLPKFLNIDTDLAYIISVFHCIVICGRGGVGWVQTANSNNAIALRILNEHCVCSNDGMNLIKQQLNEYYGFA